MKEKMKGMEKGEPTTGGEYIPPEDTLPFDPTEGERRPTDEGDPSDALTGDLTGDGQGDSGSGDGQGQGDGDSDGGDGDNGGDSDSCDSSDGGNEASCDNPSEDSDTQPTDDPQDASGDDDSDSKDESDSEKDSNNEDADSNNQESGDKAEKDEKDGKSDDKGDSDGDDSGDESGDGDTPLTPEDEDALQQCVDEAEDGRDNAQEAFQNADPEEAEKAADQARDAAEEAYDICDPHENPEDNDKVQEAEDYADEAEEFAELAKELEEEIQQLFEESGLDEEDYEDFKQGLLDELFGEDSDFSEELTEREKRIKEKIKRRDSLMQGRGLIRCVNWETGAIKAFPENETIGDTWIQITQFFSPFETKNGKQIVVDRTIAGAVEMAKGLGIKVLHSNKKEAKFESDKADFVDALKKMRMFQVRSTGNLAVKDGTTEIKY